MPSGDIHHLRIAQEANAAAYRRLVQTSAPGECWDILVLTAANEKQASGYRAELALRHRSVATAGAFFPAIQKSIVVADPPGRRAGSGGATLGVLHSLQRELGISLDRLQQLRILLIHSGGASQRLPMYSALGKIFSPLPLLRPDGQIATLFDHLYVTLCGLPEKLGPGMLILAGDVFLLFDHRHITAPRQGVTAITMRVLAELGRSHGVFVTTPEGIIRSTLQKVSPEVMRQRGATDAHGRILIDTGMLFFDAAATQRLVTLAGLQHRVAAPIDLYEDMALALATDTQPRPYLTQGNPTIRRRLWAALHGIPFTSMEIAGEFLHLGTTRQFRDAMTDRSEVPAAKLFQQNILVHSQWKHNSSPRINPRIYHSVLSRNGAISTRAQLGHGSVIEHSLLQTPASIGRNCVVSQTVALRDPLVLPDDVLFFQVPVQTRTGRLYAQVLCGTADDFKGRFDDGQCLYLNQPIEQWLQRHRIKPSELWGNLPASQRTLWTARLFPATPERDACSAALWLCSPRRATAATLKRWRKSPRLSMAMILETADTAGLIEHREAVAASLQTGRILDQIRQSDTSPADVHLAHHTTPAAYSAAQAALHHFAAAPSRTPDQALQQARAWWTISQIAARPDHPDPIAARAQCDPAARQAFASVAIASELGYRRIEPRTLTPKPLPPGTLVEAAAPVRLDLTGGWSDTPPYCYEEGGHVVNVAINLDGRPPVRSTIAITREEQIVIDSRDLGQTLTTTARELRTKPADPHDPFALHRLALQLTGWLDHRAASRSIGLHLTTECRVPKGSGLGTSSILAATLIAALLRAGGREPSVDQLIHYTLLLEQRLSTGGGWQDQVGGIVGGVKSAITPPGVPQQPAVEKLALSEKHLLALERRLVVYYSGQQRLARDILRRVEGRWIAREPAAVLLKRELKSSAATLRGALLRTDWPKVADEINRYWRIKCQLYPGSTTPAIDLLMLQGRQHSLAASLAGAGGGGFGYFLCHNAEQANRLRELLCTPGVNSPTLASVYDTQINRRGLELSIKKA